MATVTFKDATRHYPGNPKPTIDKLNIDINDGELMVFVGPSGCGKSTSLRMLAGLEEVNGGQIFIGDRDVTNLSPKDRDVAMVFQNYALYPHMSVADNMGFALKIAGVAKDEIKKRVDEAAKILDLAPYLERKPKALSGGQRQRVAMGRAIVRSPQVFLMDEPLSNLDAKLRVQTRTQIASLQRRLGVTTLYVTHDQTEAMTMGDRVAVLKDGYLMQCDAPRYMYDHPNNVFVAGFIGSPAMNLLDLPVVDGGVKLGGYVVPVSREDLGGATHVTYGIRPEDMDLSTDGTGLELVVEPRGPQVLDIHRMHHEHELPAQQSRLGKAEPAHAVRGGDLRNRDARSPRDRRERVTCAHDVDAALAGCRDGPARHARRRRPTGGNAKSRANANRIGVDNAVGLGDRTCGGAGAHGDRAQRVAATNDDALPSCRSRDDRPRTPLRDVQTLTDLQQVGVDDRVGSDDRGGGCAVGRGDRLDRLARPHDMGRAVCRGGCGPHRSDQCRRDRAPLPDLNSAENDHRVSVGDWIANR